MLHIRLEPSTTRSELREAHEAIAAGDGAPATLSLADDLRALTPGQFSAWMQLVLSWGQDVVGRRLEITPIMLERVLSREPLSDVEVIAVLLAEIVTVGDHVVTGQVQAPVRAVLAERKVLTPHTGDGPEPTWSLLLAAQTFTNRTSPDLHAQWEGAPAVEETARTLYHDIWPLPSAPTALRAPLLEFGEVAIPERQPTHITRWAAKERAANGEIKPFVSLGARAPRARGLALDLATRVRQQPKPLHDEVGEILFELVQNTEWHAAKWAGGRTGANCRVVTFREYSFDRAGLQAAADFDPNFVAYAQAAGDYAEKHIGNRVERVVFGAVTVIDSGVGLARSVALSLDEEHLLSEDTEVRYLIAALSKNLKRRRVDLGNIGLARVQQSLTNLSGFMSVRTGTVELLRNFVTRPFEPLPERAQKAPPPLILDWIPPREEDFVVGPRLGTAVTVVYPVDFEVAA